MSEVWDAMKRVKEALLAQDGFPEFDEVFVIEGTAYLLDGDHIVGVVPASMIEEKQKKKN